MSESQHLPDASVDPAAQSPAPDRAQYGAAAVLALLGLVTMASALRTSTAFSRNDPVGPRVFPLLVGALLLVASAAYIVEIRRGGRGEQEIGEDIVAGSSIDWRTVLALGGAFAANAVLIERAGWVISGSILFWVASIALGTRRYVRSLALAILLALVTFYGFAVGLGVDLPAGILQGIL
jgi:putative tricarboxylic transport membrane protein